MIRSGNALCAIVAIDVFPALRYTRKGVQMNVPTHLMDGTFSGAVVCVQTDIFTNSLTPLIFCSTLKIKIVYGAVNTSLEPP